MEEPNPHLDAISPLFEDPAASSSSSQLERRERRSVTYRVNISISNGVAAATETRDQAWSCVVVLVTFWFFASMTLILGFYGPVDLHLGPNSSHLLQANSLLVQEIQVRAESKPQTGPMLYDFMKLPSLDLKTNWSEFHTVNLPANFHKEWIYYLNKGSEINISYSVRSISASPISLAIAEGRENLVEWLEDPTYPDTTLWWNVVYGDGAIQQRIFRSSNYYVAVANLDAEGVEVLLNLSMQAIVYNTTGAYYKCLLKNNLCSLNLFLFGESAAVLTTPTEEVVL